MFVYLLRMVRAYNQQRPHAGPITLNGSKELKEWASAAHQLHQAAETYKGKTETLSKHVQSLISQVGFLYTQPEALLSVHAGQVAGSGRVSFCMLSGCPLEHSLDLLLLPHLI